MILYDQGHVEGNEIRRIRREAGGDAGEARRMDGSGPVAVRLLASAASLGFASAVVDLQ